MTLAGQSADQRKNISSSLTIGGRALTCPAVMGILNVTPDSFSDGGSFVAINDAKRRAVAMAESGAAIIDIGGESTRPGAESVSTEEELDRVLPVVEAVRQAVDVPISIDTSNPLVMRAAVASGAALINDVRALQNDGAMAAAADLDVSVCLMHMRGEPRTMQDAPRYDDIVEDVSAFLQQRMAKCLSAGIAEQQIILDPGFGFGKTDEQNLQLLSGMQALTQLGRPVLVGLSRKAALGVVTGRAVADRAAAGFAAAVLAIVNGASLVRTHDVRGTVDALRVTSAVLEA